MTTRLATIEEIGGLYLVWNDHINVSVSYRRILHGETDVHGIDPNELRKPLERARHQGHTLEEIIKDANQFADLQSLIENQQDHPLTGDAIDE